jgi:hypothetical protein
MTPLGLSTSSTRSSAIFGCNKGHRLASAIKDRMSGTPFPSI